MEEGAIKTVNVGKGQLTEYLKYKEELYKKRVKLNKQESIIVIGLASVLTLILIISGIKTSFTGDKYNIEALGKTMVILTALILFMVINIFYHKRQKVNKVTKNKYITDKLYYNKYLFLEGLSNKQITRIGEAIGKDEEELLVVNEDEDIIRVIIKE